MITKVPSIKRIGFVIALFTLLFSLLVYQLVQLSVIRAPMLQSIAKMQHHLKVEVPPVRGQILDRQGKELAMSLRVPSVYGVPRLIGKKQKEKLTQKISNILDLKPSFVRKRLNRDKSFIWLKRKVSFDEAEAIRKLNDPGLGITYEYKRFYPKGDLAASVLGFVNTDNKGLEGMELTQDKQLRGRPGLRHTKRDAKGREIKAFEMKAIPAVDGNKIYLTLDQYLQYLTERSLDRAYRKWKAKGAAAILMEVETGRILALANRPTFNPNQYSISKADHRRNRTVTDMYEPGSVFKIVAASAALNEGKVLPETIFDCENGEYRYGRRILHDAHPYGDLTFEEVIIKSSNIGTVKIAATLEPEVFQSYIEGFGFGTYTGIDMPGEAPGFTRPPSRWSKTSPYNIPMGHEIMVTLVQVARAMAVVANGGKLVTPHIVSHIEDQNGVVLKEIKPKTVRQVIHPDVAETMRGILTRVVDEGTGRRAQIEGIKVGGKTGTAQKVLPNGGGYSKSDFISSFVGFGPSEKPSLVMAVMLDDPGPRYYGGTVAAPVFQEVMEAALIQRGYVPPNAEILPPPVASTTNPQKRPLAAQMV